jgi:Flp pilus assembly protein TadD
MPTPVITPRVVPGMPSVPVDELTATDRARAISEETLAGLLAESTVAERTPADPLALHVALEEARQGIVRNEPHRALEALDRVWTDDLIDEEPWYLRGGALGLLGRTADAEEIVRTGLARRPTSVALHLLNALVQLDVTSLTEAQTSLTRALSIRPDEPLLLAQLAVVAHRQGRTADAQMLIARAAQINPLDLAIPYAKEQIESSPLRGAREVPNGIEGRWEAVPANVTENDVRSSDVTLRAELTAAKAQLTYGAPQRTLGTPGSGSPRLLASAELAPSRADGAPAIDVNHAVAAAEASSIDAAESATPKSAERVPASEALPLEKSAPAAPPTAQATSDRHASGGRTPSATATPVRPATPGVFGTRNPNEIEGSDATLGAGSVGTDASLGNNVSTRETPGVSRQPGGNAPFLDRAAAADATASPERDSSNGNPALAHGDSILVSSTDAEHQTRSMSSVSDGGVSASRRAPEADGSPGRSVVRVSSNGAQRRFTPALTDDDLAALLPVKVYAVDERDAEVSVVRSAPTDREIDHSRMPKETDRRVTSESRLFARTPRYGAAVDVVDAVTAQRESARRAMGIRLGLALLGRGTTRNDTDVTVSLTGVVRDLPTLADVAPPPAPERPTGPRGGTPSWVSTEWMASQMMSDPARAHAGPSISLGGLALAMMVLTMWRIGGTAGLIVSLALAAILSIRRNG